MGVDMSIGFVDKITSREVEQSSGVEIAEFAGLDNQPTSGTDGSLYRDTDTNMLWQWDDTFGAIVHPFLYGNIDSLIGHAVGTEANETELVGFFEQISGGSINYTGTKIEIVTAANAQNATIRVTSGMSDGDGLYLMGRFQATNTSGDDGANRITLDDGVYRRSLQIEHTRTSEGPTFAKSGAYVPEGYFADRDGFSCVSSERWLNVYFPPRDESTHSQDYAPAMCWIDGQVVPIAVMGSLETNGGIRLLIGDGDSDCYGTTTIRDLRVGRIAA